MWLEALGTIGARRVILVDAVNPFLAAIMASLVLKGEETLSIWAYVGMVITVYSVVVISLENEGGKKHNDEEEVKR